VRVWDEQEVLLLRTAADMIGNTLQRWHSRWNCIERSGNWKERVQARTRALSERLQIEHALAAISAACWVPPISIGMWRNARRRWAD